jgi:arylsulfatase A-like enzyme
MRHAICGILTLIAVAACGGSGGDGGTAPPGTSSPPPPPEPPTAISETPNVLLIIADDYGVDLSAQYPYTGDAPDTPTLDDLAINGVVFDNFWTTPSCASTRAALITGKYGIHSGVDGTPGTLNPTHETIQSYLQNYPETEGYASAVFGKWHIGNSPDHPATVGITHFAGMENNVGDYYDWTLTVNGARQSSTTYNTTHITDLTIDWIGTQNSPWFVWLAYAAPHGPAHLPPANLHNRNLSGTDTNISNNRRDYILASIEAMDSEIGRLLDSLPAEERDNTLVIFMGDNGSSAYVIDRNVFPRQHSKNSMYEGGLRAPLVVSGSGVTRIGEREDALVNVTDLFSTIASVSGNNVTDIYDSVSFASALTDSNFAGREHLFIRYTDANLDGLAVRDAGFKILEENGDAQEMYDMATDLAENFNLLPGDATTEAKRAVLQQVADDIENGGGSGGPGSSNPIDITDAILTNLSANCADYVESYTSSVTDINNNVNFNGDLVIEVADGACTFATNSIPNHDFNDLDRFVTNVSGQDDLYEVTANPGFAAAPTRLTLTLDDAIMLNGVKVDLLAAGCFGVGDGRIGCNNIDQPWRYDPIFAASGFRVDSHNAHTQRDGTYHYHGTPNALFWSNTPVESPVVGFAADGFPIFGSYFDDQGNVRKATSSYQLKSGMRPSGPDDPGGTYDGTFRDDYEYVPGAGDLDECNGMTVDGVYGYYITDAFPYIVACFRGIPNLSFQK